MKNKRMFLTAIGFCVIVALTLLTTAPTVYAGSDKKIVWTFAQLAHGKWCDNKLFGEWLPKRMTEATNGRLEIHVPVGLVPAAEMLAAVRDGVIQGAVTGTPYYSGEWPLGSFHAIPGVLKENDEFPAVANAVAWDYWDKSLKEKYNIRVAAMNHWPGIRLYCKKPIRTIDDFKGVKIRGMGYYDTLAIEKTGARGLSIPWDEAFLAVQRGVVDGLVTGLVVYESLGYADYCKYVHSWPVHGASCGAFIIMNGDAFEALPADLKPIVKKVLKEAGDKNMACNILRVNDSVKSLKAKGIEFIDPSEEDYKKCLEMLKPVREAWLNQCKKAGSPEAGEMLDKIEAFLADYRAKKGK